MDILSLFFPRCCYICNKQGEYLCPTCKKLFKRNLPECYLCRRISNGFDTHQDCHIKLENRIENKDHLDRIFVCWEYNKQTSTILKTLKYKYVTDTSEVLFGFFLECLKTSCFNKYLKDTLLIPVPISRQRMRDRGFNQSELFSTYVSHSLGLDVCTDLILRKNDNTHQSLMDKGERKKIQNEMNPFQIENSLKYINVLEKKYASITILDDVITTGSTLESVFKCLRNKFPRIPIQALCMFRGKMRY